jgi:hypothetical protein
MCLIKAFSSAAKTGEIKKMPKINKAAKKFNELIFFMVYFVQTA